MPSFTVYGLVDPTNCEIFYIGQTIYAPTYRLYSHMLFSQKSSRPAYLRMCDIKNKGFRPKIITLEKFDNDGSETHDITSRLAKENFYIQEFSKLGTLLNIIGNPLYVKETKTFKQPTKRKYLVYRHKTYTVEDEPESKYPKPYDPFKNPRFLKKVIM